MLEGGGYGEFATTPAGQCLPVPHGYSLQEAGALCEGLFTCWANLVEIGQLKAGERLLVHGGASGIGSLAIQLARQIGAEVFVTAGGEAKTAFCRALGAYAVDYKATPFRPALEAATEGEGVDVILDYVGARYFADNLSLLRRHGRLISLAFLSGSKAEVSLAPLMQKQLRWIGSTLRNRPPSEKAQLAHAIRQHAWPWLENGDVKPRIDSEFALEDAQNACKRMDENLNIGKIVLKVAA